MFNLTPQMKIVSIWCYHKTKRFLWSLHIDFKSIYCAKTRMNDGSANFKKLESSNKAAGEILAVSKLSQSQYQRPFLKTRGVISSEASTTRE